MGSRTFGSKVALVDGAYKFQRIWALYKIRIYAGVTLDLLENLYKKMGRSAAKTVKKYAVASVHA